MNHDTAAIRPTLPSNILRCLGAGCMDKDMCARHRDRGTKDSRCVMTLMDDRGYACHAYINTWLTVEERESAVPQTEGATP